MTPQERRLAELKRQLLRAEYARDCFEVAISYEKTGDHDRSVEMEEIGRYSADKIVGPRISA